MNDNPEWNESCYFNFYDSENDFAVLTRIGNKPNKDEKSMFVFVISKEFVGGMKFECPCDGKTWSCANLSYEESGENKWKLKYEGPVFSFKDKTPANLSFSIDWMAVNPLMDYRDCVDEKGTELSSKVASEHYEQFGIAKGKIVFNEKSISFVGNGERDRSSGVREWSSPKMWIWFNSVFDNRIAYNVTKLDAGIGEVDAGYFFDGTNHPIVKAEIKLQSGNGPVPDGYDAVMKTKDGKEFTVKSKSLSKMITPIADGVALVEAVTETEFNGTKGYGIAEMLIHI